MLYFIFFFIIIVGSVTPRKDEVIFLPIDSTLAPFLLNILKDCTDKVGVDSNTVRKLIEWEFEDNEPEKKLLHCYVTTSGYGDENGILKKDKFAQLIGNHKTKDEFLKVIDECNQLKGNDKYETSYKILNCYRNNSPTLFKFKI